MIMTTAFTIACKTICSARRSIKTYSKGIQNRNNHCTIAKKMQIVTSLNFNRRSREMKSGKGAEREKEYNAFVCVISVNEILRAQSTFSLACTFKCIKLSCCVFFRCCFCDFCRCCSCGCCCFCKFKYSVWSFAHSF